MGWVEVTKEDFDRFMQDFNTKRDGWGNADLFYMEHGAGLVSGRVRYERVYVSQSGRDGEPPYHINPKYITRKVRANGK